VIGQWKENKPQDHSYLHVNTCYTCIYMLRTVPPYTEVFLQRL